MKNKNSNIITLKIRYEVSQEEQDTILSFIKNYNNVLRFTYNRLKENTALTTAEITKAQSNLNNIFIDSHFKNSAIHDASSLKDRDEKIIFGGKELFKKRCQNKISKEEFELKKLRPLNSIGEANKKGNRKFQILDCESILFKPSKDIHIVLNLITNDIQYKQHLTYLLELQELREIPITYKLDLEYVYISFSYNVLNSSQYSTRKNRIMAIDMNPNYIGYSIVDWKGERDYTIIASGIYSLKPLNDFENSLNIKSSSDEAKGITEKRKYEIIHIAKELFKLCKHYKCGIFAIEQLKMKNKNHNKGKKTNKLINKQWGRNLLVRQIKKRILSSSTRYQEVNPAYSSFIGNIIFRDLKLPDMILASIEIGRRGYEFTCQYIYKTNPIKKNIIFPDFDLFSSETRTSLEENGGEELMNKIKTWKDLYSWMKESEVKYRFLLDKALEEHKSRVFSKNYLKRYLIQYTF